MNLPPVTHHPSPQTGLSQCDKILAELQRHVGQWVSMPRLYLVSGAFAVHSRISDLRERGHTIEQKNERGDDAAVHSFYRLIIGTPETLPAAA